MKDEVLEFVLPLFLTSSFRLHPSSFLIVAVYVDNLTDWGWRHGLSCHLIADSVGELLEFAVSIGLRPEWFQPKSSPHFDLTTDSRKAAVRMGAIELSRRDFVTKLRELRGSRLKMSAKIGFKGHENKNG